jgi:hypothetical protein
MGWMSEHGEDYEVPPEVTQLEGLQDLSWHNDVCPRFGCNDEGIGPNLWVDHVDPEKRECCPTPRYLVVFQVSDCSSSDDVVLYHGDDVHEAIEAFVNALRIRN